LDRSQWDLPDNESRRCHLHRAHAQASIKQRRLLDAPVRLALVLGEFDNQDAIFCSKRNECLLIG